MEELIISDILSHLFLRFGQLYLIFCLEIQFFLI